MSFNVFSVPAFFIVLREVLEACLVVGIVLAYLNKSGALHLRKWVWYGAGVGITLSLIFGISFVAVYYTSGRKLFSGNAEKIFEGIVFLIAAALLTWMILWMASMGKEMQGELEVKVDGYIEAEDKQGKIGVFTMVFVQVLREGIETWIFLFGANLSSDDKNAWRAIPLPGILAIIVSLLVSYAVFRGMVMLDLTDFFFYSSVILIAFSAGLTSHAFHELQEANWFGEWAKVKTDRDWWNARLWSTKDCCDDKNNQFFALLRALFGYQDTPTFLEWGTYFIYWIIIIAILVPTNWRRVRSARYMVASVAKKSTGFSILATFVGFIYTVSNPTWNGILTMTIGLVLSIAAVFVVYDFFSSKLGAIRRPMALVTGISFTLLTLLIATLHIAQMACDEDGVAACSLPRFYYVGLIFSEEWASTGRAEDGNSWISLAVLSWSLVISFFFFGVLSFSLILFAGNVKSDGEYMYDGDKNISLTESQTAEHSATEA